MQRKWKWFLIIGVVSLIADLATKVWANQALPVDSRGYGIPVVIIENFFDFRLSYNTGSAFGLFGSVGGARIFLSVIGVVAVIAMIFMVKNARNDQTRLVSGLGLVVGGAVGNLVDRIWVGKVTDFVVWKYYEREWPTFNIADVVLVVGVAMLFLDFSREAKVDSDEDKTKDKS